MIEKLEAELLRITRRDTCKEFNLLQTIHGVGNVLSLTILYEMHTVERFPTVKNFLSYARLVKGSVASAGKIKGLRGGKLGNPYLRWAFGEAAVIAKRSHPMLKEFAKRLEIKHGGQWHSGGQTGPCRLLHAEAGHSFRFGETRGHINLMERTAGNRSSELGSI